MDDIKRFAAVLGMKPQREVQEVVPVGDGHAVRTHDGQWTLVRADGQLVHGVAAPEPAVEVAHADDPDPEPVADGPQAPAKPAPKRRART